MPEPTAVAHIAGENSDTMDDLSVRAPSPPRVDPPGADRPGAPLSRVLAPHWRSIVMLAVITLLASVALFVSLPRPHAGEVQVVDPKPAIAAASTVPGFPVFVPAPLPAGWHPNSARFQRSKAGVHLHIGYLAPDGGYAGLEETNVIDVYRFVTSMSAGAVFRGYVTIGGEGWTRLASNRKVQDSLVWYGPNSVVVVTGTTSVANLETFAESLHVSG